jgi:hypothetical protein
VDRRWIRVLSINSRRAPWRGRASARIGAQVPLDGSGRGSGGQPTLEPRPLPSESRSVRPQASFVSGQGSDEDWGKGDGEPLPLVSIRARDGEPSPPPRAPSAAGGH